MRPKQCVSWFPFSDNSKQCDATDAWRQQWREVTMPSFVIGWRTRTWNLPLKTGPLNCRHGNMGDLCVLWHWHISRQLPPSAFYLYFVCQQQPYVTLEFLAGSDRIITAFASAPRSFWQKKSNKKNDDITTVIVKFCKIMAVVSWMNLINAHSYSIVS